MNKTLKIINRMNSAKIPFVKRFWHIWLRTVYSCDIMPGLTIGNGCIFAHQGLGVVINPDCVIGQNVKIGANVVIGGRGGNPIVPIIEDNVEIGASTVIIGPIRIGHDSKIGAGSVVVKDIPPYSVAVGNPAKVIKILNQ